MSQDKRTRGPRTNAGGGKNAGGMAGITPANDSSGVPGGSPGGGRGRVGGGGKAQREHGIGPTQQAADTAASTRAGTGVRKGRSAQAGQTGQGTQEGRSPVDISDAGPGGGRAGRRHAKPSPDAGIA